MNAPPAFDEFPETTPADWRVAAEEALKGAPFEKKLRTRTPDGVTLEPIYFREDAVEAWPGLPPFTRGGSSLGARHPLIAQEIPAADPAEYNRLLREDLMAGQNCAPLVLNAAGRHACNPGAGEEDRGLSLTTLTELRSALAGVDLAAAPLIVWAGASALPFLSLLESLAVERGEDAGKWRGAVLGDPLSEWARDGELAVGLSDAFDEMASSLRWGADVMPGLRLVGIQAGLWADAGGSAVQELAFGLATGAEYLRELTGRGVDIDVAATQVVMEFSLQSRIFPQMAKLRAARRLWAAVVGAFGGGDAPPVIHGRTSRFNKSTLDPHANLLRATGEAFAGLCGGVDSLQVAPFDEPGGTPGALSRRVARNVPIILAEECGLLDVADPAGGSWYVETLTNELAAAAWAKFQEIESLGGMTAALREGVPQKSVADAGAARLAAAAEGRELFVGVNLSPNPAENGTGLRNSPPPDGPPWMLPRKVTPKAAIVRVRMCRAAGEYEGLRAGASDWKKARGSAPRVWLANFGPPRQHRPRADFSSAFFACGGFAVDEGAGVSDTAEAVSRALASQAPVVVVCSTDETYSGIVPPFAKALKTARPGLRLFVAGAPGSHEEDFRAAGVDGFFHLRTNRVAFLGNLLAGLWGNGGPA